MPSTESPIVLGLWPIAGVTTIGVTEDDAEKTIATAIDCGITTFDTAYSYGYDGESDRLLGRFLQGRRERYRVIGKVGQRWDQDHRRIVDASPATLTRDAEESLRRMATDHFDLLMLHSPDPVVSLDQSAEAMRDLQRRGLCRELGICNVTPSQYEEYAEALRVRDSHCSALQCPLNLLQRDSQKELIPACDRGDCQVDVYWTLMKGLLAGRMKRDHVFAEGDSRPGYEIYQGAAWERAQDLLDAMRTLSEEAGLTVAQLSIGWAISQPSIRSALVGGRRPEQVTEIAAARQISADLVEAIDGLVANAG